MRTHGGRWRGCPRGEAAARGGPGWRLPETTTYRLRSHTGLRPRRIQHIGRRVRGAPRNSCFARGVGGRSKERTAAGRAERGNHHLTAANPSRAAPPSETYAGPGMESLAQRGAANRGLACDRGQNERAGRQLETRWDGGHSRPRNLRKSQPQGVDSNCRWGWNGRRGGQPSGCQVLTTSISRSTTRETVIVCPFWRGSGTCRDPGRAPCSPASVSRGRDDGEMFDPERHERGRHG